MELRLLKNNFERLQTLYQESLEENDKIKSEHEVQTIKANEEYARIIAQNEALQEKNETLYKLVKCYLEKNNDNRDDNEHRNQDSQEVQVVENNSEAGSWSQNKLRGFKKKTVPFKNTARETEIPENSCRDRPQMSPQSQLTIRDQNTRPDQLSNTNRTERETNNQGRLCRFFTATGWCRYEERTGRKCNFIHDSSQCQAIPMCNFGINCRNQRCSYSHPRIRSYRSNLQRSNFLGNMQSGQNVNQWPSQVTTNPWLHQDHARNFQLNQNQLNQNQQQLSQ